MIIEVAISDLKLGQYVLDIVDQTGTYQLKGPGHVKSQAIIDHLAKHGVLSLLIDTRKSLTIKNEKSGDIQFTRPEQTDTYIAPLAFEISQAKALFSHSKHIQQQVLRNILNDVDVDLAPVKEVADDTVNAVFKNPDALACVLNIRFKDDYLLEHAVSVSVLMTIFCRHLGIEKRLTKELAIGAFLHDVGKIKIPDEILNKPGKLTPEEFVIMQSHVEHSVEIINNITGISDISLEVAALHHEKLNGNGYPYQLVADDISLYGRMITICDIFDALTANRVYKAGYCHVKAFNILRKLAQDGELDLPLVDQFIRCMGVYPIGSLVELNANRLAIVEARTDDPIRPKVRSFYDIDHRHYTMAEDIDLSSVEGVTIKSVRADDFNLEMNKIVEFLMLQG
ncbi:HD-GYP domain-containing protein [Thalassotalea euphylliae]|uniref:HD-GYP domain-containing protein n=1 Tax=Thalassotalea euphylliae TaxID=1655234 RepID=A0A3E0TUZ3_9GAMM|nr:HD-GYP domain-containing protein [Thalassotalea euphylliae]REL28187.1 HD-GYP domain-containing protein [Thalassotalea euphylliae]